MAPDEMGAVVQMIAAEQARPERNIVYVGNESDGIRAELDELEPDWATTARVVGAPDGSIRGAVIVELDEEIGRAWIFGPWVAGDDWEACASELFDAALEQVPDAVAARECSGLVANVRLQSLAESRGWQRTAVHHALAIDAATVDSWRGTSGQLRLATPDDLDGIAALHDAEFPGTHTSTDRMLDRMTVIVATDGPVLTGYAAGQVHPDGEGYIDYVGVDPARRREGIGRQLVMDLTRGLIDAAPRGVVALAVDDNRTAARALYASLGFVTQMTFVAYRS